eukprot:m.14039 g.14039  ORF g.14039 m.14039 type:complete len:110 (+) comp6119_c0_seq1:115-444(+)
MKTRWFGLFKREWLFYVCVCAVTHGVLQHDVLPLACHVAYTHLCPTMLGPISSYSSLLTHSCWNEPSEAKMDPPSQEENMTSVVELDMLILKRVLGGARSSSSLCKRSE